MPDREPRQNREALPEALSNPSTMSNYAYVAIDPHGLEMRGTLESTDQSEALRRIKERRPGTR